MNKKMILAMFGLLFTYGARAADQDIQELITISCKQSLYKFAEHSVIRKEKTEKEKLMVKKWEEVQALPTINNEAFQKLCAEFEELHGLIWKEWQNSKG